MTFTITVRCASGHTEILTRSSPLRESAEVMARVLRTGKCGKRCACGAICGAQLGATVKQRPEGEALDDLPRTRDVPNNEFN